MQELRKLDLQQAQRHAAMLQAYLPDSFTRYVRFVPLF